ncbi:MAG: N-acetylmuramoyl-L-alanine amidase [Actinobacteria bacterium]|nr:N-acetylmuramoyl-L-alanine amidase [Actinomycetota bacterium]
MSVPHLPPITLPRIFTLLLLLSVAWPGAAVADVTLVTRDVPLTAEPSREQASRVLAESDAPGRFNLVGIHWRGSGTVEFRTARRTGEWSGWRRARPEAEDRPDPGTEEASRRAGWKLGNPWWTGLAHRIQYRTSGRVTRLRAHFLWSEAEEATRTPARAYAPAIISRRAWGANESIVRAAPSYADRLAFAVVHHTAGASPSTAAESAAIVRGIQAYHVRSNGWNDIGYNFLVDRFGQVFEGRGGGVGKNVVGAHAMGFNTGSVGVAVIGTYESAGISTSARDALVSLLAWRLDVGHVDPLSRVRRVSLGSPRFPAGQTVTLNAIGGHRDTGLTSCPGAVLYSKLVAIRTAVAARGLPKLYGPTLSGELGGLVRFRAQLSTSRDWTVKVTNEAGEEVGSGTGTGTLVDWTWNSSAVPPGSYFYDIRAGSGIRPASGAVGTLVPLEVERVTASPTVVTPNGDGVRDTTVVRFSLSVPADVRVTLRDGAGATAATIISRRWFGSGPASIPWSGTKADGTPVPDGRYEIVVEASSGTEEVTATSSLTVDRTLGALSAKPLEFSPNGDGARDAARAAWTLARDAYVRVRVASGRATVATIVDGAVAAGSTSVSWDGTAAGAVVPDGAYRLVVSATTELGTRRLARAVTLDTTPAVVSAVAAERRSGGTRVRFTLSERAWVTVTFGTRSERVWRGAGVRSLWRPDDVRRVRLVARDVARNVGVERVARVRRAR